MAQAQAESALMNGGSSEFIQFVGHLHPVLVHLPIGFILLLAVLEVVALSPRFKDATSGRGVVVASSVLVVIFSAACGWVLSWSGGYDERTLAWHKWLGTALVPVVVILAVLQWRGWIRAYRVWLLATVVLLVVTGHFGGSLTHGSDYLLPFKKTSVESGNPSTSPEDGTQNGASGQPVFGAVVQPIFNKYCITCHGPEKSKAKLRLNTVENVFKGGESGPVIEPGNAAQSLMIKRLLLPEDNDDHMPPSGKKQPPPNVIALLRWWINVGAPVDKTVEELKMPEVE